MKLKNTDAIIVLLGLILFFLVLSVIYSMFIISGGVDSNFKAFQVFIPLIVFTGFFIFLIGAMLIALAIFRRFNRFR
jgi:hypothetical protein